MGWRHYPDAGARQGASIRHGEAGMRQSTAHTNPICWSLAAILTGLLLGAPGASATPQEEHQGSQILRELESGKLKCSEAGAADFELVGEHAMGRMFGSPSQHEA